MFVHDALNKVGARANRWGGGRGGLSDLAVCSFFFIYLFRSSFQGCSSRAVKKSIQRLDKAADERLGLFYIRVGTFSTPSD